MPAPARTLIETRYEQMFPTLEPAEIDRLRRFGETRTYGAGDHLVTTGEPSPGMLVILSGEVAVTQHNLLGPRPADRHARRRARSWASWRSSPAARRWSTRRRRSRSRRWSSRRARLRDVMVAEAELGERIMRALILRRVGLLESGIAGPVIVGHAQDGDVLRLAGFLARNGHPHQTLDPDTDSCAQDAARALPRRGRRELPIVLCPNGQLLRNPERGRARALHRPGASRSIRPGLRRGHRRRRTGRPRRGGLRGVRRPVGDRARLPRLRRPGGRVGADRELSRLSDRHQRHGADGARLQPGAEVRRRDGDPRRGRALAVPAGATPARDSSSVSRTANASARAPS